MARVKPNHLTPKRAAKKALKEVMAASTNPVKDWTPIPLYIDKHTPKEQAAVFRKINQIIKFLKGGEK